MFNIAIPIIPIGFIADTFYIDRFCSDMFHTDTFHTDMFCLGTYYTSTGTVRYPIHTNTLSCKSTLSYMPFPKKYCYFLAKQLVVKKLPRKNTYRWFF
jgi:hypothetical protein